MTKPSLLKELIARAEQADEAAEWPEESWRVLETLGGLRWAIPQGHGGEECSPAEMLNHYEALAGACLTTCFILSQRDAACRRLREHGSFKLCDRLLPGLADGSHFATVGVSHLTTSRQHLKPALLAIDRGDHFVLDGFMPWVTGAAHADYLVTGATLEDGRQILTVLPTDLPGVSIGAPLRLMALAGSITTEVRCHNVKLDRQWLLAGPVEGVLAQGRGGPGGLETSCLALGLATAATEYLLDEAKARPQLAERAERLRRSAYAQRQDLHQYAEHGGAPDQPTQMRARANTLVIRATQTALTASKGTGFVRDHPAQRWARQAMFFLVWSCPAPAAEATLAALAPAEGPECWI